MKWLFFISFITYSVVLIAQQEYKGILFIDNKKYKEYNFSSYDSLLNLKWIYKLSSYKFILIDSVIHEKTQIRVYSTLLKTFPCIISISDSINKKIYRKKISSTHNTKYYFSKIISNFENNGYPFANIVLDTIFIENQVLNVSYKIKSNAFIIYDSLDIIGKQIIRKSFLHSYLNIYPGKFYQEKNISKIEKKLSQLNFYKISRSPEVYFINNKAITRLFLEKNNANVFNGLIGFGTLPNNSFAINGNLQVVLNNLLRLADSWDIQWKRHDVASQNLYFKGNLPYLFSNPIGITGILMLQKQDTTYMNIRYKAGLNLYTTGFNGAMIFYEKRQTLILNNTAENIVPLSTSLAGIAFLHNELNHSYLPTKGYYVNATFAYGKKSLNNQGNDSLISVVANKDKPFVTTINGIALVPVKRWLSFKIASECGIIEPVHFRNELFRLGGSNSIRGFDEESIYASSYFLGSIENRFVFDRNTHFFLFYDKMYYKSLKNITDKPWAIGIGAEINSNAGLFFVSYALGSQYGQPLNFKTAKIHFGYKNRF